MIMMTKTGEASSFGAYSRLLVRLHALIAAGKGDDQEADDVRDLMDSFWYKFTEDELQLARQLSANLYLIDPAETLPYTSDETFDPGLAARLGEARERKDFLGALHLLDTHTREIGAYRALSLIGLCYYHLGLPDVSILFAERAVDFASNKIQGKLSLLLSMIRTGKRERAVQIARDLLSEPETLELGQRLFCATVLLGESHLHDEELRMKFVMEAMTEFEEILTMLSSKQAASDDGLKVDCLYFMGEAAYLLGNTREAMDFLNQAIRLNSRDERSLILRGMLKLRTDFKSAIKDFNEAIANGTRTFEAYYYVAYDAIASEDFDKCLQYAQLGLTQTSDAESMAELHEMIAYSLVGKCTSFEELPVHEIRRHFRTAIQLAPFDAKYDQRLQEFEAFINQNRIPKRRALRPADMTIKGVESRVEKYLEPVSPF